MNESSKDDRTSALKVAKKCLKKNDGSSMKVKALAKMVAEQIGDGLKYKDVQKWIADSDKFALDGKKVTISSSSKKKRSSSSKDSSSSEPSKKKSKKENNDSTIRNNNTGRSSVSTSTAAGSTLDIDAWRKDNKIVVKHAKDDEEGQEQTKLLNVDPNYFPLKSFDECKAVIAEPLIRQCTDGNGFEKPSPIQSQSWPILMQKSKDGRKRDVVGIAETGSGKTMGTSNISLFVCYRLQEGQHKPYVFPSFFFSHLSYCYYYTTLHHTTLHYTPNHSICSACTNIDDEEWYSGTETSSPDVSP